MAQQFDIVGNLLLKVDGAEAGVNKLRNSLSKLKLPNNIDSDLKKSFSNLDGLFSKYKSQLQNGFKTKADVSGFTKTAKDINAEYDRITKKISQLNNTNVSFNIKNDSIITAEKNLNHLLETHKKLVQDTKNSIGIDLAAVTKAGSRSTNVKDISSQLSTAIDTGNMQKAVELAQQLKVKMVDLKSAQTSWEKAGHDVSLTDTLNKIITACQKGANSFDDLEKETREAAQVLANLQVDDLEKLNQVLDGISGDWDKSTSAMKAASGEMEAYANATQSAAQQVKDLQQSTQYFFSLRNMINLLKRGIDQAVESVKNLDAAMTETAVVTDFSVSDMWEKLPEYTANANALGATIQDMYESTTLYYQQGLNTQQAMSIATETMKMARIAGLEAKDATDMMTAALRGFNMELDNTSATRINDVYSNLAAKTASDTKEIGTAMQRTASIAHSAGMSFEGTAAFLAQAIETTREPAENLGTAMKTIVARFTELKKNPLEIAEVDGEEVSYNKVDTALQSIGVSLKDANGQFRALDEVFLDISKKWDGLSQTQQRYIATIAAGSRQQSRFIAMMSDYGRTVELMSYANDSAGASQEQFSKTMESFEAKVHQLQNAWQRFTMGIANEKFVKGAIDGLTGVLTVVNNIIDKISGGNGLVKSLLSVATAFMGLKTGGRIINKLIGGLGGLVDPTSSFKTGFKGGAIKQGQTGAAQAKAISDPIVSAINRIYNQLSGKNTEKVALERGNWQAFRESQKNFTQTAQKGTFGATMGTLQGLDKSQINTILANNPGIENRLQRTANEYIKNLDLNDGIKAQVTKAVPSMFKAFKQDPNMSPDKFVQNFNPGLLGKSLMKAEEPAMQQAGKQLMQTYADTYKKYSDEGRDVFLKANNLSSITDLKDNKGMAQAYAKFVKERRDAFNQGNLENLQLLEPSKYEVLAQKVGAVGSVFGTAGQAVTTFGMALSKLGLEGIGSALTTVGNSLSTVGATIGSIAMTMASVTQAGGLAAIFAPIVPYLPIILGVGIAIGGITTILVKHHNKLKEIKKTAEEVSNSYKEIKEQTQSNLSALKQYQTQAANWAKGVDANGNNVSLSDEDYNAYLEAVDKIAELNPKIVQGYNAQGHAILDINDALRETIALEEKHQKDALKKYTKPESLQKLLDARNIDKNYNTAVQTKVQGTGYRTQGEKVDEKVIKAAPMTDAVKNTIKQLQKQDWFDAAQFKEQFGIDVDNLTDDMIHKFVNSQDTINMAMTNWASAADGEFSKALTKSFNTLGEQTALFDEAIQPAYQALQTYVSNLPGFDNIAAEFKGSIMSGLKDIVIRPDLDAKGMQNEARVLVQEFDNLTSEGSAYATAMKEVEQAQDKFAQSLDAAEYAKGTEDALTTLNNLMEQYTGKTDAYSQAIAEYLQNQIDRIKNFTEEGAISLSEALNTATNKIAAAEGAYDSFKEATKSDFATGAESMKSIFDEITKETDGIALHMQGKGDKAFWTGAESLFGADTIADKTPQQVKKMFDRIEPMLKEGQAGFDAFWTDVFSDKNYAKLKEIDGVFMDQEDWSLKWDDNINPDVFHEMAQALGMSDEFLTSMLNKGRQFGAIDFIDTDDVRKALSTDTAAVKGTSTTTANGQQLTDIFVKGDYIKSALADANIITPQDQQEAIDRLASQGVHVIKDPDQIGANDLKNMGISDMASLIKTLGDTGQYTRDEIEAYAEKLGDYTPEDFADGYQQYLDMQEHPEIAPIQSIESTVQQIASILASNRIEEGHIDNDQRSKDFQRSVLGEAGVRDTMAQKFSVGKNENGERLSVDEYKASRDVLVEAKGQADAYINELTIGLQNATGKEKELMQSELDRMTQSRDKLEEYIAAGDQAFKNAIGDRAAEQAKQAALDAGASKADAAGIAAKARAEAEETGKEITQEAIDGYITGLKNDGKINQVKQAGEETGKAYTDTGTKNVGAKQSTSGETTKYVTEFESINKDKVAQDEKEIKDSADEGATHTTEFKTVGEKETKGAIKQMTDAGSETKKIKLGTSVDTSGAKKVASAISGTKTNIPVGIKDNATAAAEKVKQTIDKKKATIDVGIRQTGNRTVSITVRKNGSTVGTTNESVATGKNNKIIHYSLPALGSLAKGSKYGRLGPKGKGGLTLTGEKGYEIAWIPSESRSMILGAEGPQMINLPSDAVVYTHQQSEDILKKRQTIDAGSHSGQARYTPSGGGGKGSGKSSGKSSSKSKKKKSKKKSKKKGSSTETINNFSIEEVVRFNIDQNLTKLTNAIADRTKDIEKTLTKIGSTYGDIVDSAKAQNSALQGVKNYNQQLLQSYQRQLADYRNRQAIVNYTDSKGKSQKKKINIKEYLNADGSANVAAIQRAGGREVQEAIYKEINSAKSLVDGINNAQKAIKDAEDQMAELGKKISEAFYQWENELTEIYDLTQRISNATSFTDRFMSQVELELSKLNAGFGDTAESIKNTRKVLIRNNSTIQQQIKDQQQMIAARQRELQLMIGTADEQEKLNKYRNITNVDDSTKTANIGWAEDQLKIAETALKYVTNRLKDVDGSIKYVIDWEGFNADNDQSPMNKETYDAIKGYLDKLENAEKEFNDAIKTQTDFIKQTYDSLKEYQDYVADMEDTLIKGIEEQIANEAENAKKVSDAVTNQLKNLLDEVKRKLDERRKQEDNAKTERDISQKQQRLAALRANTAGGNQVEIAQLEKEIAEAQQSYQRTLEDQLLDRLQQQADEAARQRERQIELAETGNQIAAANNKELVDSWLKDPQNSKELIRDAWLEANGYNEKGEAGQYILEQEFESQFAELVTAVEQSGFNNLEKPFTAIEGNTNTLVYLLTQLTNGLIGMGDELSLGFDALTDVTLRNTESLENLSKDLEGAKKAKASGIDAGTLKQLGYSASDLVDANYTPKELYDAGFEAKELYNANITNINDLKNAGYNAEQINKAGIDNALDFKNAGFTAEDLKNIFTLDKLIDAKFNANDLREAGYDAGTLRATGQFTASDLKNSGYTAQQLQRGGYDQYALGEAGYSYNEARALYSLNDLKSVAQYASQAQQEQATIDRNNRINAYNAAITAAHNAGTVNKNTLSDAISKGAAIGYGADVVARALAEGDKGGGVTWKEVAKAAKQLGYDRTVVASWSPKNKYLKAATTKTQWKKYATGGLANYTGPAWLDGTPSKPELVLNSRDTQNFLALRDVLSKAIGSTNSINNTYGGDNIFEININVDKIEKDYDVDRVADRVKKKILESSSYRNVTQVRNFR